MKIAGVRSLPIPTTNQLVAAAKRGRSQSQERDNAGKERPGQKPPRSILTAVAREYAARAGSGGAKTVAATASWRMNVEATARKG